MGCKIFFLFLMFLLLSNFVLGEIIISEVMYNPEGSDTYCEWIELYNSGISEVNLSDWRIVDMNGGLSKENNRTISFTNQTIISPANYFIIAKELDNFTYYWNFSYPIAKSSFVLNNDQEIISLYSPNSSLVDTFYYNKSFGADGDGDSLQLFNGSWCAALPTPGGENYCPPPQSFTLNYPLDVLNDGTVFLVRANILNFPEGSYDIKVDIKDENGTRIGRIYNENEKKWKSTSYYLDNAFSVKDEATEYLLYLKIDPEKEYTGTATLQGKLRDSLITPVYAFKAANFNFYEDSSLEENFLPEETKETDSSIEIIDSDSEIKFGEVLKIKLNVYRGDTRKYAVNAYVERKGKKISEKVTMHFKDKFTDYTLTIPIQIEPNCDGKIDEGGADIVVEGLDAEDREGITISGTDKGLCKFFQPEELEDKPIKEISTKEIKNEESNEIATSGNSVDVPVSNSIDEKKKAILDEITGVVVYESSSEKAKHLIPSVLIAMLCLICLGLLFRR